MNIVGIIPARMGSSRFPGKPMALIGSVPMIGHVYNRACLCKSLSGVYVATCDAEIFEYIRGIGGQAIMTADTHKRASDRTAEALLNIEAQTGQTIDIVIMLQGDEPMIVPEMIDAAVAPLIDDPSIQISNLMTTIETRVEHEDENEVKVVVDRNSDALYFSREPIPSQKKYNKKYECYKQVCVIPFTRNYLLYYTELEPTPLEIIESVDMNRLLEHGQKVRMVLTGHKTYAVDTAQDLEHVSKLMKEDPLCKKYLD